MRMWGRLVRTFPLPCCCHHTNVLIAENPKKSAFLKAIEDREDDDGIDYLGEMDEAATDSQAEGTQDEQIAASQAGHSAPAEAANTSLKRKLPEDFAVNKDNIRTDMSHRRRPAADHGFTVKPVGIAELRESISMLIDEPLVPNSQASDASDDEEEDEEPHVRQRRNDGNGSAVLTAVRASVINRLTVSRQNSMDTEDNDTSGPVAFHSSTSTVGMFKIPSLLRRATTNLSNASTSSTGTTTPTHASGNENAVRMGGSKKSNIHFQAREAERMKKVRDVEERRREGIRKSVVGKGRVSVLGNSLGRRGSGFE
jgi:mediator of replication checkpoint protein 1